MNLLARSLIFFSIGSLVGFVAAEESLLKLQQNVHPKRERRHTLKYGRCDPTLTFLGQGQQILHEMPIRREKFFIRPKATFRRIVLQVRLDNLISPNHPKVYEPSIEFLSQDLRKLNVDSNAWIEVTAEALKSKSFWLDYWKLRLTVNGKWKREVEVRKWWKVYAFDSLVISGEGGAEWSFDCFPDDSLPHAESHKSLEDLDLEDDSVWMIGFLVVGTVLFVVVIASAVVYCRKKERQQLGTVNTFFTMSKSFRLKNPKKNESIYEEIGLERRTAAFTLSDLRRLDLKSCQPPPLPQPNPPREGIPAVMSPVSLSLSDVPENDWYNSLEVAKDSTCQASESCAGPQCEQAEQHRRAENVYSNSPRVSVKNETYVDMRRLTTK